MSPDQRDVVLEAARALERWGAARDWVGSDPYDGLNARRLGAARRGRLTSRFFIQVVKRSPLDLRRLLDIPPAVSSVTLAHAIAAYARNGFLSPEETRDMLERAVARLGQLRCAGFEEPCWGYHFDVHTRVFSYPKGVPNTIATAFAGLALLDAHERTGNQLALELARGAGEFFVHHVPQTEDSGGAFFGYLVGDRTPIHNANVLVCALLARLGRRLNRPELTDTAAAGATYTIVRQRPDGSWPYGERAILDWIDNFHTGYVLECLLTCHQHGAAPDALPALGRGLSFYSNVLFRADGAPKYTPKSQYPIDCQCVAQAIQTFARLAPWFPGYGALAHRVFEFATSQMRRPDGVFLFQRRRIWTNRTPHMRWCEAPMLLALMHLSGMLHEGLDDPELTDQLTGPPQRGGHTVAE